MVLSPDFWLNHPNELIRLRRYFLPASEVPDFKICPSYSAEPSVCVVLSTFGSIPYIDLNLHFLVEVNHLPVLIHDDHSPDHEALIELCEKYAPHVSLYTTEERMWHRSKVGTGGDTNAFLVGLQWAKQNGHDILLKLSRRMIPTCDFVTDLRQLAKESCGATFGSWCEPDGFPIRTECMAMNVQAWSQEWLLKQLAFVVQNRVPVFAEYWFNDAARILDAANESGTFRAYKAAHRVKPSLGSYVRWSKIMAEHHYVKCPNSLWHSCNPPEDYWHMSQKVFGSRYTLNDFGGVENF